MVTNYKDGEGERDEYMSWYWYKVIDEKSLCFSWIHYSHHISFFNPFNCAFLNEFWGLGPEHLSEIQVDHSSLGRLLLPLN